MFSTVSSDIQGHIRKRISGSDDEYKCNIPLPIELHVADTRLVAIAKAGFSKLPLPIRNIVHAVVEFQKEDAKTKEMTHAYNLQQLVSNLDMFISIVSNAVDQLNSFQDTHCKDLISLWHTDLDEQLKGLATDLEAKFAGVKRPGLPYEAGSDPWSRIVALHNNVHLLAHENRKLARAPVSLEPPQPNLTEVLRRVDISKQYRRKAQELAQGVFGATPDATLPSSTESSSDVIVSKEETPDISLLISQCDDLRLRASRMWHPYRRSIQTALSTKCDTNYILANVASVVAGSREIPILSSEFLQEELAFAVESFPCDKSLLKTCMTASKDGVKLAHARKLIEMKNEYTTQISLRIKQLDLLIGQLHAAQSARVFS
jgi:hypothetical protein